MFERKRRASVGIRAIRSLSSKRQGESGSAMVIALLVMILLMAFVALAISRTNNETIASANDEAETRAFEAASASLEVMTRNFDKVFETKITFDSADKTRIEGQYPPGFTPEYTFNQLITQTAATKEVVLTGEFFQGLYARRDEWQLDTTASHSQNGVQVALRRKFLNDRVPIFQFGIFYDDDLEFHPGPRFDFGGRVHTNGSLFLQAGTGVYFSSKVSATDHVFTDVSKNGSPWTNWNDEVFIKNASGSYVQLQNNMGSVLNTVVNGTAVTGDPLPVAYRSNNWKSNSNLFQGNLLSNQKSLQLPIKINSDQGGLNLDVVEIIKRGKNVGDLHNDGTGTASSPSIVAVTAPKEDDKVTAADRYYNKTGLRISLADSKQKLPGCAAATNLTDCGIRLDGDAIGKASGAITGPRGYVPRAMVGTPAYQATPINGDRFSTGNKETWIKVETVVFNPATIKYDAVDVTQDILSLGVTEAAPNIGSNFVIQDANYNANGIDSRSIIKLQRYAIGGPAIPNTTGATTSNGYLTSATWAGSGYNYVRVGTISNTITTNRCNNGAIALTPDDAGTISSGASYFPGGFTSDNRAAMRTAAITGLTGQYGCVVPFPINMFDTREGLYNDTSTVFDPDSTTAPGYGQNVPWAGVISMVDIDVANLKKYLDGTWNANMPITTPYFTATSHALRSTDVPQNSGWVLYVSDRRGDYDFDGEYDMEDVYGNNDGLTQVGEDINRSNSLQAEYANEAVRYTGTGNSISPDIASVFDHKYFRRGVRLINGTQPPGTYNATTPANTRGFTVASENGVYVLGNYNATGIASVGTPTASTAYNPQNTTAHIPASVAGDAVTILSNNWNDSKSFVYPFSLGSRTATETTMRFALLGGDTLTSLNGTPNQGGGDPRMNGGVHNFMRFLENWGTRFNYAGSLINMFNSRNNNGPFKCCNNVYDPPERNWVFDSSFLDVNRLPPGTPYFQNIAVTGFQRVNQ